MDYNIEYFIAKFSAIPEDKMIVDELDDEEGGHCANGWCGIASNFFNNQVVTEEARALQQILSPLEITPTGPERDYDIFWERIGYSMKAADINNGDTAEYQQPTPKQRILAALHDVKAQQQAITQCKALVKLSHYQTEIA